MKCITLFSLDVEFPVEFELRREPDLSGEDINSMLVIVLFPLCVLRTNVSVIMTYVTIDTYTSVTVTCDTRHGVKR